MEVLYTHPIVLFNELNLFVDHMVMTLSVRMDDRDFVEREVTFFNCGDHTS